MMVMIGKRLTLVSIYIITVQFTCLLGLVVVVVLQRCNWSIGSFDSSRIHHTELDHDSPIVSKIIRGQIIPDCSHDSIFDPIDGCVMDPRLKLTGNESLDIGCSQSAYLYGPDAKMFSFARYKSGHRKAYEIPFNINRYNHTSNNNSTLISSEYPIYALALNDSGIPTVKVGNATILVDSAHMKLSILVQLFDWITYDINQNAKPRATLNIDTHSLFHSNKARTPWNFTAFGSKTYAHGVVSMKRLFFSVPLSGKCDSLLYITLYLSVSGPKCLDLN